MSDGDHEKRGKGGGEGPGTVGLDDLIALNEEIAALVRAGVPLERGLSDLSGDVGGRLGALSGRLADRMARGQSLTEALASEGDRVPAPYRAVVEAGLRAGRLPAALEGLATFARGLAELRRLIGVALIYPLLVVVLAYVLFVAFVVGLAPRFVETFRGFRLPDIGPAEWLSWLGESAPYWGPIPPVLLALGVVAWLRGGRAGVLRPGGIGGLLGRFPWAGRLLSDARAGLYADLLALLIENRVPMPEAVALAGEAMGDRRLRRASERIAEATGRGERLNESAHGQIGLPPMLRWLLATGREQGGLVPALRHAGATYRQRASQRAEVIRTFLPALMMIAIGGAAAMIYGLTLFVPMARLLTDLGMP